ncbi:phospholipid scramblase 1-like [Eleutherodactylus coqui]|uniref:phospholipid scramblase 1-like n=1 Tax=Eleutherodactylus coqui TaxID=57060 RepID=UPI003461B452
MDIKDPQDHPNYDPYAEGPLLQNQPMGIPAPQPDPNCLPGLEYLCRIDELLIYQKEELLKDCSCFEISNKYEIKNSMGQRVYFAAEQNDCCTRYWCGSERPFTIAIIDNCGREVIRLTRPFRCSLCCFPGCQQKLEVQAPPGIIVGYVKENCHLYLPRFTILNGREKEVLKVHGPFCMYGCCSDVDFELKSLGDDVVGRIRKLSTGSTKEPLTDANKFEVQFPVELDVKMKACVLGACFLIDFMLYQKSTEY